MPIGEENCRHCDKRSNKIIPDILPFAAGLFRVDLHWTALTADPPARDDGTATLTTIPCPIIIAA
jgi:hypothetical protein